MFFLDVKCLFSRYAASGKGPKEHSKVFLSWLIQGCGVKF
jgi:hypothetical protein